MATIYIPLIIFIILYIIQIIQGIRKIKMTHELIDTFNKASKAKSLNKLRQILVPQMPKLKALNPTYPMDALSYEKSDYEFEETVRIIYSQLFTIQDYLLFHKWQIINPVTPLKDIFLLPSKALSFLGINLNNVISTVISLATWLTLNHDKIKSLVETLKPIIEKIFH